ncbi:hypothetical protein BN1708_003784 [Verticillium longisporum]|uniref:NAD(+) ADP-ribosyltransferase n=1 Tax=Verticillium longisporum TaxID=100787 RepID=A0A0G4LPW5_VERLO|nr:hypothetical protein BN1708_003784 [Verticillium longisporum]
MGRTRSSAASAAGANNPAATTSPLDGCVVVLGGSFPGHTQAELSGEIRSLGATVATTVTKKTTHVIVTQANYKSNAKVGQALAQEDCLVVSLEWVDESKRLNSKAPEDQFALNDDDDSDADAAPATKAASTTPPTANPAPAPAASNGTANGSRNGGATRKRPIVAVKSDSDDEDKKKAPVKKQKATNSKPADKKPDVVDQVAKSKDMVIPLDEGVSDVYKVFIDPSGMIYDASLNQSNSSNNNNKFYRIQLLQDGSSFKTWTRWGRVGALLNRVRRAPTRQGLERHVVNGAALLQPLQRLADHHVFQLEAVDVAHPAEELPPEVAPAGHVAGLGAVSHECDLPQLDALERRRKLANDVEERFLVNGEDAKIDAFKTRKVDCRRQAQNVRGVGRCGKLGSIRLVRAWIGKPFEEVIWCIIAVKVETQVFEVGQM